MHSQLQWTFTTQVTMHNSLEELLQLEKGRNRDLNYGTVTYVNVASERTVRKRIPQRVV